MIEYDKGKLKEKLKRIAKASAVATEIMEKIGDLPYTGKLRVLYDWYEVPVAVFIDDNLPVDHLCGIMAELEVMLGMEDAVMGSYPDIGRVEYKTTYKGHPFYMFSFPNNDTCQWVKVGEQVVDRMELVCA